ncbi:arginine kinase-like [Physella acuta]|uniref:arginine kinase-like n=1 Tax=Physella acuta TaxID=109671 RepID=UPI0027DC7926|nr:arginine kinase-like [Physella acuta]
MADTETPAAPANEETTENQVEETPTENSTSAPAVEAAAPAPEKPAAVNEAQALFKALTAATDCRSLLHKHLTQAVFDKIKDNKTKLGGTLADCIRSGCENLDSGVGIYASDPEAYKVFAEVLDPVIKDYHKLPEKKNIHHPNLHFGDVDKNKFEDLDPEGKYVISTRIRVGRSQDGYGFPPILSLEDRKELEKKAVEALNGLSDELKGTYHPLTGMDEETQTKLTQDHFLFKDDDRFLKAAGGYNDWPTGRGIYFNENKTFLVWVNEEDHLRIISMQKGGDIGAVYKRLVVAVKKLEEKLKFARDDRLGYLTFCPTNLGTTLRASVHIKIPNLSASEKFKSICDSLNLQARGIHGEHTDSEGGVYDISNKRRLGLTEFQAVQEMYDGVKEIIKQEKEMAWRPQNLDEMFEHVNKAKNCKSLLKKYLTKDVYEKLKDKKTANNATLGDCIISGVLNLDSGIGLYAADPECYTEFALLFDPVIKEYHNIRSTIAQPAIDYGDIEKLKTYENFDYHLIDPKAEMIVSTRIRVARSLKGFPFHPVLRSEDRIEIEKKCVEAFNSLTGEFKGTYYPLSEMSKETQKQLTEEHFLFNDHDRFLKAAGGYNDWPTGRGIFFNETKTFLVWVNEEDHLRIISMQKGADIVTVYKRLVDGLKLLEEKLTFARDDRLGYLNFCPSNLGSTLRGSCLMKIPQLSSKRDFKYFCDKLRVQARGIHGEHTDSEDGIFEISNKRRLGFSEAEAVKDMGFGVSEIMKMEREAEVFKTKSCHVL